MRGFCDTPILIDYLKGIAAARVEMESYEQVSISVITWIEVLVGAPSAEREAAWRAWLGTFNVVGLSDSVSDRTVAVRRARRLKLPDAIILATAEELGLPLVTRNTKDFAETDPRIRVPYRL